MSGGVFISIALFPVGEVGVYQRLVGTEAASVALFLPLC